MERIQKFSDAPLTVCPHCGGELEQLISAPAIQFKGSGWYVNDYAKKSSGAQASRNNGSAATSESKAESAPTEAASGKDKSRSSKGAPAPGKDKASDKK
jgi:putative FmdB family regulatory protein